jgi:hypothetical protein
MPIPPVAGTPAAPGSEAGTGASQGPVTDGVSFPPSLGRRRAERSRRVIPAESPWAGAAGAAPGGPAGPGVTSGRRVGAATGRRTAGVAGAASGRRTAGVAGAASGRRTGGGVAGMTGVGPECRDAPLPRSRGAGPDPTASPAGQGLGSTALRRCGRAVSSAAADALPAGRPLDDGSRDADPDPTGPCPTGAWAGAPCDGVPWPAGADPGPQAASAPTMSAQDESPPPSDRAARSRRRRVGWSGSGGGSVIRPRAAPSPCA